MLNYKEIFFDLLKKNEETLNDAEKHVLEHLKAREPISRNVHKELSDQLTFGQRVADKVASFGGSWPFIIIFGSFLLGWIFLNSFLLIKLNVKPFDVRPYILLNLILSMLAAIQAPVIMMSQNRQVEHDRADAQHDYEVNLKAEIEIMAVHQKLDELRDQQWEHLIDFQKQQIAMLENMLTLIKETKNDTSA